MAKLLLEPCNLLILDEPTNHLDMRSKDILKKALLNYDGTLIAVSHDREFLDGLVTKVYEFGSRKIREHLGGIYEFLSGKKLDSLAELERKEISRINRSVKDETTNKQAFTEKKEQDREIRKLENKIGKTEQKIAALETELAEFEHKITDPSIALDIINKPDFYASYDNLKTEYALQMEQWEQLHSDLELLKNKRN